MSGWQFIVNGIVLYAIALHIHESIGIAQFVGITIEINTFYKIIGIVINIHFSCGAKIIIGDVCVIGRKCNISWLHQIGGDASTFLESIAVYNFHFGRIVNNQVSFVAFHANGLKNFAQHSTVVIAAEDVVLLLMSEDADHLSDALARASDAAMVSVEGRKAAGGDARPQTGRGGRGRLKTGSKQAKA